MSKADYNGIWIYAEHENGTLSQTPLELLAKAVNLKEKLGGRDTVTAVILGKDVSRLSDTLFAYGAERVIAVDDDKLAEYKHRVYTDALVKLTEKYKPSIFLFAASNIGRELAPRVMCRLGTGLTADAIDLDVDEDGVFVQTTPNFGGSILSHIAIPEKRPQMCTVHPKVFAPMEPKTGTSGELIVEKLDIIGDDSFIILGRENKSSDGTPLDKAEAVVAGGFGVKDEESLNILRELASLIGAKVGGSRPLCETGMLSHDKQIGQSGTTITPKLIINIAISGSVQYMAGMDKSKTVISVNRDAAAPIFDLSNYGVIADYKTFIPALIAEIKARKGL